MFGLTSVAVEMDTCTQTLQGGLNDSMYHVCTYIIRINARRLLHDAICPICFHTTPYNCHNQLPLTRLSVRPMLSLVNAVPEMEMNIQYRDSSKARDYLRT